MNQLIRILFAALCALSLQTLPAAAQPQEDPAAAAATETRIDLNTATEDELISLPGIGPAKAQAIMEYRSRRPFRRVEQIMRVRGVGRGIYRQIRDHVVVSEPQQR